MDWAAIKRGITDTAVAIVDRTTAAAAWISAHPGVAAIGAASVAALSALVLAGLACHAARRAANRGDSAARTAEHIQAAVSDLRHELAEHTARSDAAFDRQRALTDDGLARLTRLESAVDQLRTEIIDQQTAKYRINEAIRQAMER